MDATTISGTALVVSIVGGVVSALSLAATSAKLKLDLYNRRFKIYEDVLALFQTVYRDWNEEESTPLAHAMIRSFRESKFLFDKEDGIYEVISQINQAYAKHAGYHKHKSNCDETNRLLHENAVQGREDYMKLLETLENKMAKYLDFHKIHGWT